MGTFSILCLTESSLYLSQEPSDFVVEHSGEVLYHPEEGSPRRAGDFVAYRALATLAASEGQDLFEVCDAHSQGLHELCRELFSPRTRQHRRWVQDVFSPMSDDFLCVGGVRLDPEWRGLKVGLLVLRKLTDLFAPPFGLTVCLPYPLGAKTPGQVKKGTLKLRRYVRQAGYRRLRKSPYYALCTSNVLPTCEEVLRGEGRGR
jgi:hypothetical protein